MLMKHHLAILQKAIWFRCSTSNLHIGYTQYSERLKNLKKRDQAKNEHENWVINSHKGHQSYETKSYIG